jgi:hypothetical protein
VAAKVVRMPASSNTAHSVATSEDRTTDFGEVVRISTALSVL